MWILKRKTVAEPRFFFYTLLRLTLAYLMANISSVAKESFVTTFSFVGKQ
jgi:hypothetical protein